MTASLESKPRQTDGVNNDEERRCPHCGRSGLVFVQRERVTWDTWQHRWFCRWCRREVTTPDDEKETT